MLNADKWSDEISFDDAPTSEPTPATPAPAAKLTPSQKAAATRAARKAAAPVAKVDQDIERIDEVGKARAAADAAIAAKLGMPVRDTVYALGTVVNSIGVENFSASRKEWKESPTLPEISRDFSSLIKAEERQDIAVTAADLSMLQTGELVASGQTLALGERAFLGLASHVTPGGAGYLKACPPDLRATNVNHWLTQAAQREKPRAMQLRTRTRNEKREAFAVVGPRYVPFDVDRVVAEAAAGIGGDARGTLKYDGYKMTLDAIFHSNIAPENAVAGEYFKGCVRVKAADDGTGSVNVTLGLWRNLCRNLIIVDFDQVLVGRRLHLGAATIENDIRELMASASERIELMVGKWSEASTEDVLARYDLQDVDQVFRGLVLNGCVKVSGVKADDMVTRLHDAWLREPGYSKTAILNAITRAAHENTWSSWADQEELESTAGELLYQPVWTLDYSDKTAEELLA